MLETSVSDVLLLLLLLLTRSSCGLETEVPRLPGRYSCSGPLCWSVVGFGGVLCSGSGKSKGGSRLIGPSSSTPPEIAGTAGLPAESGSAESCSVMWIPGRRATRQGKRFLFKKKEHCIKCISLTYKKTS